MFNLSPSNSFKPTFSQPSSLATQETHETTLKTFAQDRAHLPSSSTFLEDTSQLATQLILDLVEVLIFHELLCRQAHYIPE